MPNAATAAVTKPRERELAFLPLEKLRFGHEAPKGSINARKTDRDADQAEMKASLLAEGVIQSVLACDLDDKGEAYYLAIGNRRLGALQALLKEGKIDGKYLVPAIIAIGITPAEALSASLAENVQRVPLHPVDRYEAFAQEAAAGRSVSVIAASHGIKRKIVEQALALGAISPKIRDVWRAGKIDQENVEHFTIEPDHVRQDAVYDRLKKSGSLYAHYIRQAFRGDTSNANGMLDHVGVEAYETAGGRFGSDLFTNSRADVAERVVLDAAILKRLFDAKVGLALAQLVEKDGWGWAEFDDNNKRYQFDRSQKKKLTVDEMKKAGCLIYFDHTGKLLTEKGWYKTRQQVAGTKAATTKADNKPSAAVVSNAMKQRLESQAARALQDALITHAAGDGLVSVLAKMAANQITPDRLGYMPSQVKVAMAAMRAAVGAAPLNEALQKRFDAKDYFGGAPKPLVLKAIEEAVNADEARKLANKPKAEIAKFAMANVPKTGWLPKDIRGPGYGGPVAAAKVSGQKPPAKANARKPAAKAPARKKAKGK